MLNEDQNQLLSRVGPGTAMGDLMRRFWMPALLSEELAGPDSGPVRLRILCEDLIAFRDSDGNVGIIRAYCSHRLAPLYFGRNEQGGLRCPFHGWKFHVSGKCLETPNVPAGSPDIRNKVGIPAYKTHESGGVIWVYMGPAEKAPPFPDLEYTSAPENYVHRSRWLQRTNWLQGVEAEVDSSHISWLHREFEPESSALPATGAAVGNASPVIEIQETSYGFTYGARREVDAGYYWRLTQWIAPMFNLIAMGPGDFVGCGGRVWVPIDDNHSTVWSFNYRTDRAFLEEEIRTLYDSGALFPPLRTKGAYALPDGYVIDTFLPSATKENDYGLSRELQMTGNFTGIYGVHDQDRAMAENSKPSDAKDPGILDRSLEHLVSSDRAIVTARRRLIKMATDLQNGIEPSHPADIESFRVRAISKLCDYPKLIDFLDEYAEEARLARKEFERPSSVQREANII